MFKDEASAYTNRFKREIVMVDVNHNIYSEYDEEEKKLIKKSLLRHEIIHAFLVESGLGKSSYQYYGAWSTNEEMVDWFSHNLPKIHRVYEELEIAE